jgi:iron complex outermembrane receptor protein
VICARRSPPGLALEQGCSAPENGNYWFQFFKHLVPLAALAVNLLRAGAAALCLGLASGLVAAQPTDALQDLEALLGTEVEGASRQLESALDAPAVVSAINRAEANVLGHWTLGDMLSLLPGIYIGTVRGYSTVGLRGLNPQGGVNNSRLFMSVDGYHVNDAVYDQALPAWEFPIVADWIKRVELVSGPASSVYGGNALLGVVNAVTLDGRDAPGLRLRAGLGSWNTRDAVLNYGGHDGGQDLFVGLALSRSDGETLHDPALRGPNTPDGRVAHQDGLRYRSLFLKWRVGEWRLSMASQERVKDMPITPYGTMLGVPGTGYTDTYDYAELAWDGAWNEDWRGAVRMNLSRSGSAGRYMTGTVDAPVLKLDNSSGNWAALDARTQWRGWINHELTLGAEGRHMYNARQRVYDVAPYHEYLSRRDSQNQTALYAQDHWRLAERWSLTLGARVDQVQGYDAAFSPRLALVARPNEHEAFKLLFGQGFRVPSLAERYYEDASGTPSDSPALQPERLRSVALAWERAVGARSRVSVHLYRDRMRELIEFLPVVGVVSQYRNVSQVRTHGLDLEAQGRLDGGVQWRASVSVQNASSEQGRLSNTPRWLSKGLLIVPLPRPGWLAAMQWMTLGRRCDDVPVRNTVDAVLRWEPLADRSLSLRAQNLFNATTWDSAPPGVPLSRIPRERRRLGIDWQQAF